MTTNVAAERFLAAGIVAEPPGVAAVVASVEATVEPGIVATVVSGVVARVVPAVGVTRVVAAVDGLGKQGTTFGEDS